MSNAVTIKLSRNARVEENIDVAKLTLDKFIEHKQGQPLLVRYYRDVEKDGRIEKIIDTEYVFQELDKLPKDFSVPEERVKPWGTGHAVL